MLLPHSDLTIVYRPSTAIPTMVDHLVTNVAKMDRSGPLEKVEGKGDRLPIWICIAKGGSIQVSLPLPTVFQV
jgi:hypothetical protein